MWRISLIGPAPWACRSTQEIHLASGWVGVLGGTSLAFYALLGFEDSVNLAEECREPARDFPRALFGGLAVAAAIYLAVGLGSDADQIRESDVGSQVEQLEQFIQDNSQ